MKFPRLSIVFKAIAGYLHTPQFGESAVAAIQADDPAFNLNAPMKYSHLSLRDAFDYVHRCIRGKQRDSVPVMQDLLNNIKEDVMDLSCDVDSFNPDTKALLYSAYVGIADFQKVLFSRTGMRGQQAIDEEAAKASVSGLQND